MHQISKFLAVPAIAAIVLSAAPTAAHATTPPNKPVGGCPAGDWFLFPTADLPTGTSGQASLDGNHDGFSCVLLIASSNPHGTRFAAVDNTAPLQ